nr:hypothetical protein [Tanacetum cinerariifolium]
MENSSKKVNDTGGQDVNEEIRAKMEDFEDGIRENDLEINKGVFGNEDNSPKADVNTEVSNSTVDPIPIDPIDNATNDSCDNENEVNSNIQRKINEELRDSNLHDPAKKVESYVNMVRKDEIPKKLNFRLTMINDTGVEVVVFDDVVVKKRRMQKSEHSKLPIWVRMTDDPLEACSIDGISALASRLGNHLIMDIATTNVCHNGMGGLDYARVLVEMDVKKEFKKVIEVQCRDGENKVKGTNIVNVFHDWKPSPCTHFKVFGHDFKGCTKSPKTLEEEEAIKRKEEEKKIKRKMVQIDLGSKEKWDKDEKKENVNGTRNEGSLKSDEDDILAEVNEINENVIANEIAEKGDFPDFLGRNDRITSPDLLEEMMLVMVDEHHVLGKINDEPLKND